MYENLQLLVDGKQAFPEIIKCINDAKKSIKINMFIWRYDNIGCMIANAIFESANRGVKVYISVDKYGVILEKAEESKLSFFHKKTNIFEKIQYNYLRVSNPKLSYKGYKSYGYDDLYEKIMNHPNITIDKDRVKKDHSKYYIFDEQIMIFGGINIEDKENGKDITGRVYQDYMIKMIGESYINSFLEKINNNKNICNDYYFGINYKENKQNIFEMKQLYLNMINNANKELLIIMPYFHNVKPITKAIINAYNRGVNITIMIPEYPNFQQQTNRKCMNILMKKTNNNIKLYFSPKMVHTKMIVTEKEITIGSTNITNKSFNVLSELNIFIKNENCELTNLLFESIKINIEQSKIISSYKDIKYNKLIAFIHGLIV